MITDAQLSQIIKTVESELLEEYGNQKDATIGLQWMSSLLLLLGALHIPLSHKNFPTVLRVLAHSIDLVLETRKDEMEKEEW